MTDILVPEEQEGTTAVVRNWLKQIGDTVSVDDPLVELETDKVTQEISASSAGVLAEIRLTDGAEVSPGTILGRIEAVDGAGEDTGQSSGPQRSEAVADQAENSGKMNGKVETRFSPAVRKALAETGIDANTIAGSGRGGRITKADVLAAAERHKAQAPASVSPEPVVAKPAERPASGSVHKVPHDKMRLTIARNMLNSVTTAPHVTAVFEADFTAIMRHREANKAAFAAEGVNLSYTAYFVLAAAAAMRAVPQMNSRWHDDCLEIFDHVDIGVGTALGDGGLIVPVIRNVQDLSLLGVAKALQDLTSRARDGKLSPEDIRGGTFTISNHGVSGSLLASPIIINQPQSAILGVGKLEKRVVVREIDGSDAMVIRPMAYVTLTIDHRVVDGSQTNLWLENFVGTLESWS